MGSVAVFQPICFAKPFCSIPLGLQIKTRTCQNLGPFPTDSCADICLSCTEMLNICIYNTFCHLPLSPGLTQPRDLHFSEVGSRGFRATWENSATDVESYFVQFKPADDTDGHYVSMALPGETLTTYIPHLNPLTRYQVNVIAQYEKGDSLPVTGYETTLEGIHVTFVF